MARTSLSLVRLARALRRDGHHVTTAGYVAAWEQFADVCARMRTHIDRLAQSREPYALIGHSLGGLILRAALGRAPLGARAPSQLIMLGTPNQPPRLARRLHHLWPYRIVNGEAGQLLADPGFFSRLPPIEVPYTIIAGTGGRRGRWSPFGSDMNDGTVAVDETRVTPDDHPILTPARHTFMMNDRHVRRAIRDVLDGTIA
jgi:thioesterase domain-containing protein